MALQTMMGGSGAPDPGMLAGLMARAPMMQQPARKPTRPVPGQSAFAGQQFYDSLAAGEPQADTELRRIFGDVRSASLEMRELLEQGWWQKLLYVNGRQWIYHDKRRGWQDKRFVRWIPRPVTNVCAETIESVRAMLSGIEPSARVRPNGNDPANVITAELADKYEPIIAEEHQMQTRWFEADFWAPACGTVWLHPYWDNENPLNTAFVQALACPTCQAPPYYVHPLDIEEGVVEGCPTCGTPGSAFVLAEDENGPIGDDEVVGAGATDVVSPLEMLIPTYFQRWEEVTELIRLRWRPKSYYEGRPYFDQIKFGTSTVEQSLQMFRSLAVMTDLTTAPIQGGAGGSQKSEGVIEAELWCKPNAKYPKGLWARFVGSTTGSALIIRDPERGVTPGPLPFKDMKDRPLWCWAYYPFKLVGGRLWGAGVLDTVITKQDQINRNDSMVELIMQRMANPIWLEPKGAEVQRFTGEPGLIVRYQIVAGSNAKPERLEGITPGAAFFQLREQYFGDVERLAGTQDVLKGITPSGVEAFSALNLLVERSQSRFTALFKARGRAYRQWYAVALELERSYGPFERVRSLSGPAGSWTFETFKKADLKGAITVVVEDGSETPKTSLGKRAAVQQAQAMQFLNAENPDTRYKGLELLGVTDMAPALDVHTRAAQIEQQEYEDWVAGGRKGPSPLKVESWQQHQIHVEQLDLWANTDTIRMLTRRDKVAELEITIHRVEHLMASVNPFGMPQMMPGAVPGMETQPQQPGPAGQPPVPGGEGAARAEANSQNESNAVDTVPGAAPGGGNMGAPA